MAKLTDKFFNRIIEGPLDLGDEENLSIPKASIEDADLEKVSLLGENALQQWNGTLKEVVGLEFSGVFCKVVRNFNELQFIMNFRATNTTESAITIASDSRLCQFASLGSEINSKIYAHNGQKVSELTSSESIAYTSLFVSKTNGAWSSANMPRYANLLYANGAGICMYNEGGALTIAGGESLDFEARISLAL